jgi:glycosyltransferase involved in cell wall biosynthesis
MNDRMSMLNLRLILFRILRDLAYLIRWTVGPVLKRSRRLASLWERFNQVTLAELTLKISGEIPQIEVRRIEGKYGVNVLGYINAESGLGEASRASIRAMAAENIPLALNNLSGPMKGVDSSYADFNKDNPYLFNLVQINAVNLPSVMIDKGLDYFKNKYNIGYWYWELSQFPPEWADRFRLLDEIWVATSFCQESLNKISPIPVLKMIPPIIVPRTTDLDRGFFGIKRFSFLFFFIFDFTSVFERKNPLGLIQAFKKAFTPNEDAQLLIKCIHSGQNIAGWEMLKKASSGMNITLMDKHLHRDEMNTLMKLSDCYVSLHRAEGFGFTLAEAMILKKPVIATGYSGNTEFMSGENSLLVKYRLVEIENNDGPYKKGNIWAEPDLNHAAELMRLVFEKRDKANQVGERASNDIKTGLSLEVTGARILRRLNLISKERGLSPQV